MFKTANDDSISRPNSRPKLPFPGNGKGKFEMPREDDSGRWTLDGRYFVFYLFVFYCYSEPVHHKALFIGFKRLEMTDDQSNKGFPVFA